MNDGVVTGMPERRRCRRRRTGARTGSTSVPHRARNGRSRKKYPPVGMPWVLGIGDSWSQMVGSVEIVVAVVVPVGPRRVLVEAVGEGLAGERAEVAVQHGVVLRQRADDRQVGHGLAAAVVVEVGVVADREGVGGGQGDAGVARRGGRPLQEAVHPAEVVLDQEPLPAVVGVAVAAALEVGSQRVVGVDVPVGRQVGHVVAAVSAGQPAQEMVERPVLHHQDRPRARCRSSRAGDSAGAALAAVWDRNWEPVIASTGGRAHELEKRSSCQHGTQYGQWP